MKRRVPFLSNVAQLSVGAALAGSFFYTLYSNGYIQPLSATRLRNDKLGIGSGATESKLEETAIEAEKSNQAWDTCLAGGWELWGSDGLEGGAWNQCDV